MGHFCCNFSAIALLATALLRVVGIAPDYGEDLDNSAWEAESVEHPAQAPADESVLVIQEGI